MSKVFIGCGAGFAGDRFDAAVPVVAALADADGERFLIYEVLAERTLAIAQRLKRDNPDRGYSPFLDSYLPLVLSDCHRHGIRVVTNMGAANPFGADRAIGGGRTVLSWASAVAATKNADHARRSTLTDLDQRTINGRDRSQA